MSNKILLVLWVLVIIGIIFIFQIVFQGVLAIRGITPNLILIFIVYTALNRGIEVGMFTGFFCGVLMDSLSLSPVGLNMVSMALLGYFVGLLREKIYKDKIFNQILISVASTIFYILLLTILLRIFHSTNRNILSLITIGLPEAIYNGAITFPFFYLLDKILPWKKFKPTMTKGNVGTIYGY